MRRWWLPVLASILALAAAAFVSVRLADAEKKARALDEVFLSALDEAQEDLAATELAVEKLLISADSAQQAALLSRISQAGTGLTRCLSVLPVDHAALTETMAFGNRLADYADSLLTVVVHSGTLPARDADQLAQELSACSRLAGELALAGQDLAQGGTELTLCDPPVSYPALEYVGRFTAADMPAPATDAPVSEQQAAVLAARLLDGEASPAGMAGGQPAAYLFSGERGGSPAMLAVTREGGGLLWMSTAGAGYVPAVEDAACAAAAERFLADQGMTDMRLVWQQEYAGLLTLTYAAQQEGVVCYADLARVQVRQDTGEVAGMDAAAWRRSHRARKIPEAALSAAEAAALISPRVQVEKVQLCLLPLNGREVLCYEFRVQREDARYLIFLDAQTGHEVLLQKVIETGSGSYAACGGRKGRRCA